MMSFPAKPKPDAERVFCAKALGSTSASKFRLAFSQMTTYSYYVCPYVSQSFCSLIRTSTMVILPIMLATSSGGQRLRKSFKAEFNDSSCCIWRRSHYGPRDYQQRPYCQCNVLLSVKHRGQIKKMNECDIQCSWGQYNCPKFGCGSKDC